MKWKEQLIEQFRSEFNKLNLTDCGIHLAIFKEPFLTLLFGGQKTIESRFAINKVSPFQKVRKGDIIFIKKSGGPICGFFTAGDVHYLQHCGPRKLQEVKNLYSEGICASYVKNFWEEREKAKYISLIEVNRLYKLSPINITKKDRLGWVVIKLSDKQTFSPSL